MSQEDYKKREGDKKRYVYLDKFLEHKEQLEKRFDYVDKQARKLSYQVIGFTIILAICLLAATTYYIFK
jgi:hypothetical protein